MDTPRTQPLAPLYYRDNFLRLCDTVQQQYADILNSAEQHYLQRFHALSGDAQCLYVRLISRTGPLFRSSKLQYSEIEHVGAALNELLHYEFAQEFPDCDTDTLASLYTRPEMEHMFSAQLHNVRTTRKSALVEAIESRELNANTLRTCREQFDPAPIVAPQGLDTVALLQLLFFGNRHQSLTEFVLEDLGVARFFPYALHPQRRLFSCRAAVEEYRVCGAFSDTRYEILEREEPGQLSGLAQELLGLEIQFDSTQPRWNKLCNGLGRDMERLEEYDLALALYSRSQSHPSRERSARILEKQEKWGAARTLCQTIAAKPRNEAERDAAQKILPRVMRKIDGTRLARPRDSFDELHLSIPAGDACVELLTAHYLKREWSDVHYVENRLINALFGLAFWPIIFADEPGVFHHPFQRAPADMYTDNFQLRRQAAIRTQLHTLETGDLPTLLTHAYNEFHGYQNQWIDWRYMSEPLIQTAASIIPAAHLLHIWQRILFDPKENRGGFPDLIAFGENAGEYAMIEVKGPGDALQNNQKRWLRFFGEHAIPAKVAWITWQDE